MNDWSSSDSAAALQLLKTDASLGLSEEGATGRLATYGPNELTEVKRRGPWLILWEQLTSVLVLILIAASVLSAIVSDYKDASTLVLVRYSSVIADGPGNQLRIEFNCFSYGRD